jgi:large subunit ribosomal protein L19e
MNLSKKKELASKVLKVGKNRLHFSQEHLSEIKEAITKQDIRDLHAEGIISIKPVLGRTKIVRRKTRRGPGKIKKTVNKRKQIYVKITRKLRNYIKDLKKLGKIDNEEYKELRKKIRMRTFRSKAHLKEQVK